MKVTDQLREIADWFDSDEGQAVIQNKGYSDYGIRRSAMLWLLDNQLDEHSETPLKGNSAVDLLCSLIIGRWAERPEERDGTLSLLCQVAMDH